MKDFIDAIATLFPETGAGTAKGSAGKSPATGNGQPKQPSYLALDIEISKEVPGDFNQWKYHRPLGISCAATQKESEQVLAWYSRLPDGTPAPQMSREDVCRLVTYLAEAQHSGWAIVTWNGLQFDWDILAEESGCWEDCARLAEMHIDMMFHLVCCKGYPLSLDKAARGMNLTGKLQGVTGDQAPRLWREGCFDLVLAYVAQDARTTLEIARSGSRTRKLEWLSNTGRPQFMPLPKGWLPVSQARTLPEPDTSWMKTPLQRAEFYQWTHAHPAKLGKPSISPSGLSLEQPYRGKIPDQMGSSSISDRLTEEQINAFLAECDQTGWD